MASSPPHFPAPGSASTPQNPAAPPPPTVAVIAIHGVGQHLPGASAEAISTLLTSIGRADSSQQHLQGPRYPGFDIHSIEVPLAAVATEPPLSHLAAALTAQRRASSSIWRWKIWQWLAAIWGAFDERRDFLAAKRQETGALSAKSPTGIAPHLAEAIQDRGEFGYQYMLAQLAHYDGEPGRNFSTMRFESRAPSGPAPVSAVHIYDAHYSDLSKQQNSFVGFFFAFYQLLFHLAALGLKAVYWAEAENAQPGLPGSPWRFFSFLHAVAVRVLIMFVPLLNLVILAIGLAAFADQLSGHAPLAVGLTLAGLLGFIATLYTRKNHRSPNRPILWAITPFLGIAAGIVVLGLFAYLGYRCLPSIPWAKWLTLITWLVLAYAGVFFIAKKFAVMRRGADWVASLLYLANAALFLFLLLPRSVAATPYEAATAAFFCTQLVFGELAFFWSLCILTEFLSWPVGRFCVSLAKTEERKCRAIAAQRTGRFAFAISASMFLIVTLALWSGVVSYATKKLEVFDNVPRKVLEAGSLSRGPLGYLIPDIQQVQQRIHALESSSGPAAQGVTSGGAIAVSTAGTAGVTPPRTKQHTWDNYLDGLLLISVTPGLPLMLALIALAFLLLLWTVLPSVMFELSSQQTPPSAASATGWAGVWLSRGLDNTAVLIRILWFAIVPVPLFFGFLNLHYWYRDAPTFFPGLLDTASRWTLPLIQGTGAVLAVSAAAIVALILKYGGSVLDTLLDVDNYLRTLPSNLTPRARIAERIASLLRYVAAYRDPQGRPYQRLVIVAHSLGTLVAADLLRFITRSPVANQEPLLRPDGLHANADAPAIPIYLFTMGSPLRPLLNRFFPHLYAWVNPIPDNSSRTSELGAALNDPPADIAQQALPDPNELSVQGWLNAYRSGDYVGRYLWSKSWLTRNTHVQGIGAAVRINDKTSPAKRAEMCIGIGAHTHYWDRTAPDVAQALDSLINNPSEIFP